jgi:quercetin dioxygenase-like cupin family protein
MIWATLFVALLAGSAMQAETLAEAPPARMPPPVVVREVFRASQPPGTDRFRSSPRADTLVVLTYDIPAGTRLPLHRHPFQRHAYVLAGRLRVATPDGRRWDYGPGDVHVELLNQWHYAETLGTEAVRLLVVDEVEGDRANLEMAP